MGRDPIDVVLSARPAKAVRAALVDRYGDAVARLDRHVTAAMNGSDEAARTYVDEWRTLTQRLLEDAHGRRPDAALNGATISTLEHVSAEAPFSPWAASFSPGEAAALELTSRVRALVGEPALTPPARAHAAVPDGVDDLDVQRFFRRVRWHLDHDEEVPLRRVMRAFDLSKTELGRLFGVRRQAVDQWLARGVPAERQEKLAALVAVADLLERKLKAGRLAGVARRPADAYGGATMLELIAADRHRELLDMVRASFDWATAA